MSQKEYHYATTSQSHTASYLMPTVESLLKHAGARRIFEIGCGNAATAAHLSSQFDVSGIDPSESGVKIANTNYPHLTIEVGSAYDDLKSRYGTFDTVISLEVIEHLYDPRSFLKRAFDLLAPGGNLVLSTPYHGYVKNLALAVSGKLDAHFTALWDGGHIKFFSRRTLSALLIESGFEAPNFKRVGRFPAIAKSMVAFTKRPLSDKD